MHAANLATPAALAALLFSLGLEAPARAADTEVFPRKFEVKEVKDLTYYDGEGMDKVKHKLDLYLPKDQKDFPVLFFVHGGAWVHGDKNFLGVYSTLGHFYASRGIGTVVINYRLSPGVKHPEHIKDVARAYAWTCKNISNYGGKDDQVFLMGHSAGGHLVALLATDQSYLKAEGASLKNVKGVLPISGVYNVPEKLMPNVFGELQQNASPQNHVRGDLPPFLIFYADKDFVGCDKEPSENFAKALKDKGVDARTKEITSCDHYRIILSAMSTGQPVSTAALEFIAAQTGKK